jgi:RNA polymerase sigma-70 factor (ECF subfamily)
MPESSEYELIQGCLKGNPVFQEQLYKTYYSMLLKVCARYVTNMEDAETLMNDSFLKAFKNLKSYRFDGSFEGWLKRIAVNTCLDFLRTHEFAHSRKTIEIREFNTNGTYHLEADIIQELEFKALLKMIQELPHTMNLVFNLYVFEEYTHKEIATQLGISEGTSQWYLHQARKTLKEKMKLKQKSNCV